MSEPHEQGLFSSLKRLLDSSLATLQNRIELFAVELHEEKCRLIEVIILAAALVALATLTLTLVTFTVVVLLWDNARLAALITLGVIYLAATVCVCRALLVRLKGPKPLSATLEELKKDRECLDITKSKL